MDKKKNGNWFTRATLNAAMADSPAVMQASGWDYDEEGNLYQDPDSKGAEELRKSLGVIGAGTLGLTGAGLLSSVGLASAGIGNAITRGLSYLQPSKYIDSIYHAVRPITHGLLSSAPIYGEATTLGGALADIGMDGYFAAKALNGVGKQGNIAGEIQNSMDLIPVAAPLFHAGRWFGRGLGNIDAYHQLLTDSKNYTKGFEYAKDKYIKRGDLMYNKRKAVDPDAVKPFKNGTLMRYNSAELIEPINQPKITLGGFNIKELGHAGKDIVLYQNSPDHLFAAFKDPRLGLRELNGTAAHEGTHWALNHLGDDLSKTSKKYYSANEKHPLYADYTSWFDTRPNYINGWFKSPEEFVAEMTRHQYLNNIPTDKRFWELGLEQRKPVARELKKTFFADSLEGVGQMVNELSKWGYKYGGLIDRLKAHYRDNDKIRAAIVKANGGPIYDPDDVMWKPEREEVQEIDIPSTNPYDWEAMKLRQYWGESRFRDNLTSPAGAKGAFQIMPITLEDYIRRGGKTGDLMDEGFNEQVRDDLVKLLRTDPYFDEANTDPMSYAAMIAGAYNMGRSGFKRRLKALEQQGYDIRHSTDWVDAFPVKETRDYMNWVGLGNDVGRDLTNEAFNAAVEKYGFAKGGKIHIKPSKRGTFTAAAKKHGKSVQAFASQVLAHKENYSPAMVKKANFARNASKWHADGGVIDRYGADRVMAALMKMKG